MISIIVPVYNSEETISRCVDSVINQSYTDWELILVDDGSTDRSSDIIEEYARKSSRIIGIHQKNSGVVVSRNEGLKIAKGEWISFVDSDDWIEPEMYESVMDRVDRCKDLDMVWVDVRAHSESAVQIVRYDASEDIIKALFTSNQHGWLWNKVYRKAFWDKTDVHTDSSCGIMEDSYMLLQLYLHQPKIGFINKALYNYSEFSGVSATSGQYVYGRGYKNIVNMYKYLSDTGKYEAYKKEINALIIKAKIDLLKSGAVISGGPRVAMNILSIPIPFPQNIVYWVGLNCGKIGRFLFDLYRRMK